MKGDVPALAQMLARSFADDPVLTYVLPAKDRQARMRRLFELDLRYLIMPLGESYTTEGEPRGAALWAPPGRWKPSTWALLRSAPAFMRIMGNRLRAAIAFNALVEKHHPKEPHYYLGTLGTDPAFQRKGVGTALLQPVLDRCDAEAIPAYLETSKDVNVPYYRRHGFEVTNQVTLPDGPPVWFMWREPQSSTTR